MRYVFSRRSIHVRSDSGVVLNENGSAVIFTLGMALLLFSALQFTLPSQKASNDVVTNARVTSARNSLVSQISRLSSLGSTFRNSLDPNLAPGTNTALFNCAIGSGSATSCTAGREQPVNLYYTPPGSTALQPLSGAGPIGVATAQPVLYDLQARPCTTANGQPSAACPFAVYTSFIATCASGPQCPVADSIQIHYVVQDPIDLTKTASGVTTGITRMSDINQTTVAINESSILPPVTGSASKNYVYTAMNTTTTTTTTPAMDPALTSAILAAYPGIDFGDEESIYYAVEEFLGYGEPMSWGTAVATTMAQALLTHGPQPEDMIMGLAASGCQTTECADFIIAGNFDSEDEAASFVDSGLALNPANMTLAVALDHTIGQLEETYDVHIQAMEAIVAAGISAGGIDLATATAMAVSYGDTTYAAEAAAGTDGSVTTTSGSSGSSGGSGQTTTTTTTTSPPTMVSTCSSCVQTTL